MRVEFDSDKDTANQAKHGVSLALAGELVWVDDRFRYGDLRMIALAPKMRLSTTQRLSNEARCDGS